MNSYQGLNNKISTIYESCVGICEGQVVGFGSEYFKRRTFVPTLIPVISDGHYKLHRVMYCGTAAGA